MATAIVRKLFESPSKAQPTEQLTTTAVPQPSPVQPPPITQLHITPLPTHQPNSLAPASSAQQSNPRASSTPSQRSFGRVFRVPSDDDGIPTATSGRTGSVSYRVPSDDEYEDDDASSRTLSGRSKAVCIQPGRELLAAQHDGQRELQLASEASSKLKGRLREIDRLLAEELERVELSIREKQAQLALADEDSRRQQGQQREQKRKQLQHQHQQTAQLHKQHVERMEAEQRKQLEAARRAEQDRRQQEEEEQRRLQRQQEEQRQRELQEQQHKLQQQQQQQQEEQAKAKAAAAAQQQQAQQQQQAAGGAQPAAAGPAASAPINGQVAISAQAQEWAQGLARKLAEAEAVTADFASSASCKADRRRLEKEITKLVQQISGTQQQVACKVRDICALLGSAPSPAAQLYASLVLSNKLLSQCDAQLTKLQSFAFPLATVAVRVGAAYPSFLEVLVAKLHKACMFTVPQYLRKRQGQSAEEYARLIGFKQVEAGEGSRLESGDEYSARVQAYVLLYAAITQVEEASNPHGLQHAWAYVARCLNYMPATRNSAAALQAFLRVAGYSMARVYRSQFQKLMLVLQQHFLPALAESSDPDTKPSLARLQTYIEKQQWRSEPEGRQLPATDHSSALRA